MRHLMLFTLPRLRLIEQALSSPDAISLTASWFAALDLLTVCGAAEKIFYPHIDNTVCFPRSVCTDASRITRRPERLFSEVRSLRGGNATEFLREGYLFQDT